MFRHHQLTQQLQIVLHDQKSSSLPLIAAVAAAYLDGMAVGVSTLETMEAALYVKVPLGTPFNKKKINSNLN